MFWIWNSDSNWPSSSCGTLPSRQAVRYCRELFQLRSEPLVDYSSENGTDVFARRAFMRAASGSRSVSRDQMSEKISRLLGFVSPSIGKFRENCSIRFGA